MRRRKPGRAGRKKPGGGDETEARWPARQAGRRGGQGWGPWLLRLLSSRPFDTVPSVHI